MINTNFVLTNFVLVKKERITAGAQGVVITSVVRSYLSEKRAFQDLQLLQEAQPDAIYDVTSIVHIDD